ncbi:MAG: hypothetical protein HQL07_16230 [Nitrospirae bacterium]|nr:hypothetical protein [Magnetococcales bacterium]
MRFDNDIIGIWGHHTHFPYGYKFNRYGVPCAVIRRILSVGETPIRQLSFQPVAIGAVVEETKRLKPSV